MELCALPIDIIKLIIGFCPYGQWFRLSKKLSTLASQAISPLTCRTSEKGALCWAITNDKILATISLLKDPRIDPSVDNNFAIRHAAKRGHSQTVKILLQDSRVDPSADNNYAIQYSSWYGHEEVVEMLLKDRRVDPSVDHNDALLRASDSGYKEIVEMLLKDRRVNPSAFTWEYAVRLARENGHKEVLEMLLKDRRVNSSAAIWKYAIKLASETGHKEVLEMLLKDSPVSRAPVGTSTRILIRTNVIARGGVSTIYTSLNSVSTNPDTINISSLTYSKRT
jgi:ankyrin repeat protein